MPAPAEDPTRRLLLGLLGMGGLITGCVLVGLGLGYLLDRLTGATPLFLFLGLALGILAAVAGTWRALHDEREN